MKAVLICIWLSCSLYSNFATGQFATGKFASDDLHASFWANYNGFGKKPTAAFEWYKKYLCQRNLPGYMYRGLLHLFKQTNNLQQIILLMPLVEDAFADDIEIQMLFVHALQQTGAEDAADARIITLVSKVKDNQELAFHAAQTYLKRKEPENALLTVNDYLSHASGRLNNFIFHFLKAQIYLMLDKKDEALVELQKSLAIHPSFDKGWLLFGLLQEQTGKIKKAIKGYRTFLEVSDQPIPHIQEHLLRLLFKQKILEAQAQNASINMSCFEQALLLFKENKYRQALEKIDESLVSEPRDKDSKILKTHILNAMDQAEQALEHVCYWIRNDKDNAVWFELAHLIACQQHLEGRLITQLRTLQNEQPHNLSIALYLSDLYARTDRTFNAVVQHKRAYALTQEPHIRAQILAHLAVIYYDHNLLDQMPELVTQAEQLNHTFAPLYNTVSYWYATKGNNLPRAQELIQVALTQESQNPYYLDTQAVIYYKQNNYKQAQALLEVSARLLPEEASVSKRLAKCCLKQQPATVQPAPALCARNNIKKVRSPLTHNVRS